MPDKFAKDIDDAVKELRTIDTRYLAEVITDFTKQKDKKISELTQTNKNLLEELKNSSSGNPDSMKGMKLIYQPFFESWYGKGSKTIDRLKGEPDFVLTWFGEWVEENRDNPDSWIDEYYQIIAERYTDGNKPN